jgi:uncharacterized protein YndB with AHSA1/START domain/catechol 2,3-dioxygenase-like lactoylglutathione lyase family enzyme
VTQAIERTYPADAATIWRLWTTPEGIESWWAPDGFEVEVRTLELRKGGELVYTMTAVAPEQVEFMRGAGMPLTTESRKTFTEIDEPVRLAYASLVDFVPGVEPYEFLTVVDLEPADGGVRVVMTVEELHDEVWTERLLMGRRNELENLAAVVVGNEVRRMPLGHIDLRVADLAAAQEFYEALLPRLGFTERYHGDEWKVWAQAAPLPFTQYFGITQSEDHVANENRIAFAAGSREEVDAVAALVGVVAKEMPYGPGYYAAFFEDPSGNRLEVYVRP